MYVADLCRVSPLTVKERHDMRNELYCYELASNEELGKGWLGGWVVGWLGGWVVGWLFVLCLFFVCSLFVLCLLVLCLLVLCLLVLCWFFVGSLLVLC